MKLKQEYYTKLKKLADIDIFNGGYSTVRMDSESKEVLNGPMEKNFYPLTNAQKSIWIADNLYPGTSQAISQATVIIRQEIDFKQMNEAINNVIRQNDAMRIRLVNENGIPQQYFAEFSYKQYDILDFSYENGESDYKLWEKKNTGTPFHLIDTDLFYFAMVKLSDSKNILYFKFHHTITDAWGIVLIVERTLKEYEQRLQGFLPELMEEPSYIDHINDELSFMSSERFKKQKEFWSGIFGTIPEFTAFSQNNGYNSYAGCRKSFDLPQSLGLRLHRFCELNHVSTYSVFYALLALYLYKWSNKKDIAIETPILNRSGLKEKNTAGLFMHNIPTRIYVDPALDFLTFVKTSSQELKKFMKNQRYPYSMILKEFREKTQFTGPLVDVTLNYYNIKRGAVFQYEGIWNYPGAQLNSLSICVRDWDDTGVPILDYDYLIDVFSEEDIDQMHNHLCNLLTDALDNPYRTLSELQMLSRDERQRLLANFNQTHVPYEAKTVPNLFEEQVLKTPNRTAIVFENNYLTYQELNEKSNQLARYLQNRGVTRNSIVGLMINRSLEMVIGIIGILKAGAAYLPIDPGYPSERIAYMLNQSQAPLTLTDKDNLPGDFVENCEYINISLSNLTIYRGETTNLYGNISNKDDVAYVLFTSGSTGKPKGVMVHHQALCNLINSVVERLHLESQTIVSLTTLSFDIFFSDTILPLTQGMKVIIANDEEQSIPRYLNKLLVKHQVEVLQATPSKMKLILKEELGRECLKNLTHLLITGEEFPSILLQHLRKVTSAEIFNLYGPTETTVWSTIQNVTHSEKITIGQPIANTQIYIMDESLNPVQSGSIGEIYIAGDGVSLGYLNNPQLTKERFLDNPWTPGQKMYRTGDLGRWLKNGEIEYLGRNDNQVKIRGVRIELEEVEARLLEHTAIQEAVVVVKEDKAGKKHLCAYLVGEQKPVHGELRSHLLKSLPHFMVPASFTWLSAIPLTPNGKIDRGALPYPSEMDFGQSALSYIAPRNDLEKKLEKLWAEALEIDELGIDDNLFALGGDSLTILEIMSAALAYDWKLSAQDFYENPTIRQFAIKINGLLKERKYTDHEVFMSRIETEQEVLVGRVDTGNVLLTGATGFLGIHLLFELLVQTDKNIYCLVRGNQPKDRLEKLLHLYFPSLPKSAEGRITVINGDFTLKQFGLDNRTYNNLVREVQTVVHCGALVSHYGPYSEFYKTNVQGTLEIIEFCNNFNKNLNYISTISVSGDFLLDHNTSKNSFSEKDFYIGQDFKANVYIRSKFKAEQEILKAEAEGLRANIFRLGIITGRYQDGKFQHNIDENAFYRRIRSIVSLGMVSKNLIDQSLEFSPVDYCAKGIAQIIKMNQSNGLVFHILNHQRISSSQLLNYIKYLGYPIQVLSNGKFEEEVIKLSQAKAGKERLSGIITDLYMDRNLNYNKKIYIDSTFTIQFLSQLGFSWPEIDITYLDKILKHMEEVGFIYNDSVKKTV